MSIARRSTVLALTLLLVASRAPGQDGAAARAPAPEQPITIDAATRAGAIEEIALALESRYIFEEIGARYAAMLRRALAAGEFDDIADPALFAETLTTRLQEVAPDLHLRINWLGPEAAAPPPAPEENAPSEQRGSRGAPEPPAASRGAAPAGDDAPAAAPPDPRDMRVEDLPPFMQSRLDQERRANYYFRAVEILPGNIGYIDYNQFGFFITSRDKADAAMTLVDGADAIIIDLRGNGGGMEGMNQYLCSHFFGDEPVHLYSRETRAGEERTDYWSWPEEPKRRFPDTPLFILVDAMTGSAAENMAFSLQGLGRATLVGQTTAGAGHNSRPTAIAGGFQLVLPFRRTYNPRTGAGWDTVGVRPDIEAPSAAALVVAHDRAITTLLNGVDDPREISRLEHARTVFAAQRAPQQTAVALADYEGQFGPFKIWNDGGVLKFIRNDAGPARSVDLLHLTAEEFVIPEIVGARLVFRRDDAGHVAEVDIHLRSGAVSTEQRVAESPGGDGNG